MRLANTIAPSAGDHLHAHAHFGAGEIGVSETVTVALTREPTEKDPDEVRGEDATGVLDIKLPSLVRVNAAEIEAIRVDGGGCPHIPTADWMSAPASTGLATVTSKYNELTGRKLSLNDASLPFGGRYDNRGGGGRSALCHVSHRVGRDIDINSLDSGSKRLCCPDSNNDGIPDDLNCKADNYVTPDGSSKPLFFFVQDFFFKAGAKQVTEGGSIHFRFPQ